MDVNAASFPHHLLELLIAVSDSDFVTFDLELSGIPNRMKGIPKSRGRQTLEDRYRETKAGAEQHQVLQVGLTCARYDWIANKYVLRPYNINISPLLDERVDVERDVTFQSGAVTFLLSNGFNFDRCFKEGVQYLSREEAEIAKKTAFDRIDNKNPISDLQLKETDIESLDFMRRVRDAIMQWRQRKDHTSLIITTETGLPEQRGVMTITRFEKRLVHQLVRAEFPDLVTVSRTECIKIIDRDELREEDNKRRLKSRVKDSINKQTGFRWVIEALARGDIDPIDPIYFARNLAGMIIAVDMQSINDRFRRASMRLKSSPAVLVGHNMFTDLVYLYQAFIGSLPDTLDGFCTAIHELFPKIIDTKYLATYAGGDLNASPTLQEIAEGLESQPLPEIATHADHSKYQDTQALHEAGYDSLLTATILLRLAAKLDAESQPKGSATSSSSEGGFGTAIAELGKRSNYSNRYIQHLSTFSLPDTQRQWSPSFGRSTQEVSSSEGGFGAAIAELGNLNNGRGHTYNPNAYVPLDAPSMNQWSPSFGRPTQTASSSGGGFGAAIAELGNLNNGRGHTYDPNAYVPSDAPPTNQWSPTFGRPTQEAFAVKTTKKTPNSWTYKKKTTSTPARFATRNKFDGLYPGAGKDNSGSSSDEPTSSTSTKSATRPWDKTEESTQHPELYPLQTTVRKPMEIIPAFNDTAFWGKYGNQLRVFGTQEGALKIADWEPDQ